MSSEERPGDDEQTVMLREIALQPAFLRNALQTTLDRTREALAAQRGRRAARGIIIGCGDSFAAGRAVRAYMMTATQRWIEPLEALEFASYLVSELPPDSFVIGVSNSGTVARTIEGIGRAREHGAWTFGVTVNAQSALATSVDTLVQVDAAPNIKQRADGTKLVTPGTLTYTASLLGLYVAAIALGEFLETLSRDRVQVAIAQLSAVSDAMAEADASVAAIAPELAATFTRERTTVILGGGPNVATAYYGAAKWYEALQWPAHHVEVEEWAHQHYFLTGSQTDTMVLLPPGAARQRGLEQLRAARDMGSRTIVIGERGDVEAEAAADVFIPMPAGIPESLTPFVYKLPFEYLAAHIAILHGIDFFGFASPLRQQVNFRQIFDSSHGPRTRRMSELLAAVAAGTKAMIGMIQLRPLAGSSRYRDGTLDDILGDALNQASILQTAGFQMLMVQNLGDLPVAQHASSVQVAWMTRIAHEIRRECRLPVGLNLLENDAEAMFAVASAADLDFVRIKVFVGAMLTPSGIESGRAFEAVRARTAWRADKVAILADVHDRTGVPIATAGLADDLRTTFAIGGADGVVLTGRSHHETLRFLATARAAFPDGVVLVGGGVSATTIAELMPFANGAIVSSALKRSGSLFGELEPRKVHEFMEAVAALRL